MMTTLQTIFESNLEILRIKVGKKQTVKTLINEVLLFAEFLRNECQVWRPRIGTMMQTKMEENKGIYIFNLHISGFSKDDILRSARTLCKKPISINGHQLKYPKNKVFHAEYDRRTEDIMVVLITDDKEIREIYEKTSPLYASASVFKKYLPLFYFTEIVLSSEPIGSGSKILLDRVPDLETAKRLIPC